MNTSQLDNIMASTPSLVGQTDAQAAASSVFAVVTPRTDTVTATTLVSVWGIAIAATVDGVLRSQVAAGSAAGASDQAKAIAAQAQIILGVLYGPGFDPANPVAQQLFAAYVAAGVITQANADAILTVTTYPLGSVPSAEDVTASRARIALRQPTDALTQQWQAIYSRGLAAIADGFIAGALPTLDSLRSL